MYRILIVDDEPIIANGIYDLLNQMTSSELDLYKCYSGDEALDILNRIRVDIVITDINMPGMDGLQLMEEINRIWPGCKVVFLTGYSSFDYVYTAIRYPNVSYILKTESYKRIVETVEAKMAEIAEELKLLDLAAKVERQMDTIRHFQQMSYLGDLLLGETDPSDRDEQLRELGLAFEPASPVALIIGRIDGQDSYAAFTGKSQRMYSVNVITEEKLTAVSAFCFAPVRSNMVWIVQPNDSFRGVIADQADHPDHPGQAGCQSQSKAGWHKFAAYLNGMLESVQNLCRETLGFTVSFAVGSVPVLWEDIHQKYRLLCGIVGFKWGDGTEMLLSEEQMVRHDTDRYNAADEREGNLPLRMEKLKACLEAGQRDEFMRLYDGLTGGVERTDANYFKTVERYYAVSSILLSYVNEKKLADKLPELHRIGQIEAHDSSSGAMFYLAGLANTLFDLRGAEQETSTASVIESIQRYIGDSLQGDLSLLQLAETFYFNPSYLSRLYKQATGTNLSDYIIDRRVAAAKELLADKQYKINEIAAKVGVDSVSNFSRYFKKHTGMTPQQYRDVHMK
ncbi:response regulator transcription factor [Cohnella silvisoli]|uniref:Response regulator n=1 Tax=Cohnella silvisoli TaxID=2873699 RepID=A0ABV1KS82_9BACL|nr:response regulator [Cohnella silvisoli]MCD9022542.1 response regulator [Cohnella silvisoli]